MQYTSAQSLPLLYLTLYHNWAASALFVLSGIRVCILDHPLPSRAVCVQMYLHRRATSLPVHLCKNANVQNSSKTLQICSESCSCRNPLFMRALENVSSSTTKTVSFLFSWSRWVASVENTKIILAHDNEKHNYMAAGGIDVINMAGKAGKETGQQPWKAAYSLTSLCLSLVNLNLISMLMQKSTV